MSKRILITGAAGFLGSHLCDKFIAEGYEVLGMDNLITGILEYAEISNTQESMQMVRLDALLEDIVGSTYQPGHIKIEVMPLPVVKGNALRFRQVFQNLIQNAIGAMDKAEGLISIQVKDHKGMHCFSVADNGKGINEKYHDMIFEKFRKS